MHYLNYLELITGVFRCITLTQVYLTYNIIRFYVYNIVTRHLYTVGNDHKKFSYCHHTQLIQY